MVKRADNKKLIQAWVDESLVKQLDGAAARLGTSRSEVLVRAVDAYLDGSRDAASKSDVELLRRDLEASFAAMAKAIKEQPIAVQQQALPGPDDWKEKPLIDRLLKR